jgi:phage shock protein A
MIVMTTKYPSQEIWNLRDSLKRAKSRASRYFESKRALETKVRDLERSRDLWKRKYEEGSQSASQPKAFPPRP